MKIFLHVGMPKSGSTSIQKALLGNKAQLLRKGVYFEYSNRLYELGRGIGAEPPHIPEGVHTAIFSDERLFKGIAGVAGARRIVEALEGLSDELRVICYVRRQDEVFVSSYYTSLLAGSAERFEDRPLKPFPIYDRLRTWESAIGRDRLVVQRYGTSYLPNGVLVDFLGKVGLQERGLAQAQRANVTPGAEALEAIRRINGLVERSDPAALKVLASIAGMGERQGLAADKRRQIVESAASENEKLSRNYFCGEPLFTHAFPDDGIEPLALDVGKVSEMTAALEHAFALEPCGGCASVDDALIALYRTAQHCSKLEQLRRRKQAQAVASQDGG